MPRRPALVLLLAATAAGPGCVHYGSDSMTRWWADRNTLDRPAFFVERIYRAPPPRERVERYRWQYGVGPGTPRLEPPPFPAIVAAPSPPPAAPPAEPATPATPMAPSAEPAMPSSAMRPARSGRPSVAWMFAPARG